jgi:hypothetical protein
MEEQRLNLEAPEVGDELDFYRTILGRDVTFQEIDENNYRFEVKNLDEAVKRAVEYGNCDIFAQAEVVLGIKVVIIIRKPEGTDISDLQFLAIHQDMHNLC